MYLLESFDFKTSFLLLEKGKIVKLSEYRQWNVSKTATSVSATTTAAAANVKQALRYRYKTLIFNFDESASVWFSSLWVRFWFWCFGMVWFG